MRNPIRNTVSVLAATLLTALAVFGGVSLIGTTVSPELSTVAMNTTATTSASTGETLTCPSTGCTASTCHATQGGGHGGGW